MKLENIELANELSGQRELVLREGIELIYTINEIVIDANDEIEITIISKNLHVRVKGSEILNTLIDIEKSKAETAEILKEQILKL